MSLALLTPMKLLGQGAAPSSHLYYSGGNATSDIWMNQVYVPVTTLYTYYSVMGWNTGSEGGGYCGIQDSPDGGHKYIFSIWDPSNGQTIKAAYVGNGTIIKNFGGEGTGLQSNNPALGWNINTWYNQVTRVWQYNGHTHFGFWIQDMNTGIWSHMVTMDYPVANVYFKNNNDAFIEDWIGSGANVRKVLYKEAWQRSTAGAWKLQKAASFSSNSGDAGRNGQYNEAFNAGVENGAFFMQIGGNTTHSFPGRTTSLSIASSATVPTLTVGAISSFQAGYQSSNKTMVANWAINQTKSPQYSYRIEIYNNSQYTGTPVLTSTGNVPHQRDAAVNVASLANGTYYVKMTINDIFDQTSAPVYASFTKNNAPSVSITSPAANAEFTSPASITINASASDETGSISSVEFYSGSTFLGSDNTAPYSFTWANATFGTYAITAKAINNAGVSSTSTAVTVKVNSQCNAGGTAFGTSPAYNNGANTFNKVFDGNTSTYFDYSKADGGYAGLDFGAGKQLYVNTISFWPRSGWGSRMVGGKFQGSNTADFSSGVVDLYTIPSSPVDNQWTTVTITPSAGFRYVRYYSAPDGNCNVAEIKFCGEFSSSNLAPSVSLTSPTNGANFTAPASFTLSANASDSDGSISKVEFYNGSTLLATDNSSPYSYSWNNVAAGSYTITAKAYDNSGAVTTAAPVSVTVTSATNQLPSVNLTSPSNGASYTAPASISITATANDADGSISKVEFYNGSTLLATDNSSPYSYSWSNVAAGTYSITAKAYDNLNAVVTSSSASVTVTTATSNCSLLTGTPFGTSPAYNNGTSSFDKAFDGDITTFFDYSVASGGYTGIDLGAAAVVNTIRFYPRSTWASRMTGGKFQGSNVADFSSGVVDLYTIPSTPAVAWTEVSISNTNAFRYLRYYSAPDGNCNVAEIQFCGTISSNQAPTVTLTTPSNGTSYTAPASVTISASAFDADGSISKVEFYNGTTLLNSDATSPYSYTWSGVAAGTYTITAKAFDNAGATVTSSAVTITVTAPTSTCTAPVWSASSIYLGGDVVQYNGVKYVANWWNTNTRPDLNNGGTGTGKPWTSQGTCGAKMSSAESLAEFNASLNLYPNPAYDYLTIESNSSIESIEIINGNGVVCIKEANTSMVNIESLSSGLYLVKIQHSGETVTRRFSKQ